MSLSINNTRLRIGVIISKIQQLNQTVTILSVFCLSVLATHLQATYTFSWIVNYYVTIYEVTSPAIIHEKH